ncbi:hypothetical protein PRIPAC_83527 [Pristionchus pacificus]|nr:hypothetical protein PRIPAC_83527 [Pristionchus pacificus]|eukprot:PDM67325.1 hypothetical protein PRIPAC_48742 [Pristionchus pacificus]
MSLWDWGNSSREYTRLHTGRKEEDAVTSREQVEIRGQIRISTMMSKPEKIEYRFPPHGTVLSTVPGNCLSFVLRACTAHHERRSEQTSHLAGGNTTPIRSAVDQHTIFKRVY